MAAPAVNEEGFGVLDCHLGTERRRACSQLRLPSATSRATHALVMCLMKVRTLPPRWYGSKIQSSSEVARDASQPVKMACPGTCKGAAHQRRAPGRSALCFQHTMTRCCSDECGDCRVARMEWGMRAWRRSEGLRKTSAPSQRRMLTRTESAATVARISTARFVVRARVTRKSNPRSAAWEAVSWTWLGEWHARERTCGFPVRRRLASRRGDRVRQRRH